MYEQATPSRAEPAPAGACVVKMLQPSTLRCEAAKLVSVNPALFFRRGPIPHQLKADVRIRIRSAVAAVAPN
jgi:hypothetical protein